MNWTQLRKELQDKFGKNGFRFYNDKNKYTRRIKICGENKQALQNYLQFRYPNLTLWKTVGGGICFNLAH